jgi:uncharacterized protein YbgA (DUF1722 family)/uncharacterized protein YbbK (DUF523 family)
MREFTKPIVVVSKCLGFAHCRYNGLTIPDDFVDKLKFCVDFHTICPEVELGLGVPREPIRVVSVDDDLKLIQPATNIDLTERMLDFAHSFLNSLEKVDGFILKSRSPSCGIKDVKVYPSAEKSMSISKGSGFFGGAVQDKFPGASIEDEGRLRNFNIREHFLTKLFMLADFREVKTSQAMKELVKFHSQNKLLLMAYDQEKMRVLGRIVANTDKKPISELFQEYENILLEAFLKPAKYTANINVLMHGMGYFSKEITSNEKAFILDSLERYKAGRIPLSVPLNILRSLIVRFQQDYLMPQTFFEPYPEGLVEITDSGKGRNM